MSRLVGGGALRGFHGRAWNGVEGRGGRGRAWRAWKGVEGRGTATPHSSKMCSGRLICTLVPSIISDETCRPARRSRKQ